MIAVSDYPLVNYCVSLHARSFADFSLFMAVAHWCSVISAVANVSILS